MKLFVLAALFTALPALADDTNLALTSAIFMGSNDPSTPNATGSVGGVGGQNDGQTAAGTTDVGQFYPGVPVGADGQIIDAFLGTGLVKSVNFYDALYWNGGWFGVSGSNEDGTTTNYASTLSAAALIAPRLQVSYSANPLDSAAVWTTVANTNNYLAALTGAAVPLDFDLSNPASVESTFTLTTPVSGITGIRLIGPTGGSDYANSAGFLGSYEIQVMATTPEPSTYAMIFGGAGLLVVVARLRRQLSV